LQDGLAEISLPSDEQQSRHRPDHSYFMKPLGKAIVAPLLR
jgi:hypothetical protein